MTFLIADDSRFARALMRSYIEELGLEVIAEAADGLEAIEKFKEFSPSVVIIDLEMPKLKGIEASMEILKLNPQSYIILATSIVDKKEIINALRIGIKKVLAKPVTQEELKNALEL